MVVSSAQKYRRLAPAPPGEESQGRQREILIFSAEQMAVSGSKTLRSMPSLRPMRARQCAASWSQVKLKYKNVPSHTSNIYHLPSISDSGKIYHQALVDQNTCNDPNYIARIAFNVAKIFRDPGSKITVRPGGGDICYLL